MNNITLPNVIRTFALYLIYLLFISQQSYGQTVIFNADFTTTSGDNAWTQAINTNGSFIINTGAGYVINSPYNTYLNDSYFAIESPVIDLSFYDNLELSFDIYYNTELNWDGAHFEYRISGGAWNVLGTAASGFYNDTDVDALGNGVDGWSGNNTGGDAFTNGLTLNLSAFDPAFDNASNVQFRYVFASDNVNVDKGTAFRNFEISGTPSGPIPATIEVTGNAVSIADNDMTPFAGDFTDFGSALVGGVLTRTFIIRNQGTDPLNLFGVSPFVSITGTDATDFTITSAPASSLGSGATTSFTVSYTASSLGIANAELIINSDASNSPSFNFAISALATPADSDLFTVVYESFDIDNGGWTVTNPGGTTSWSYGLNGLSGESGEGNYWYTDNYNNYSPNSDTYVTSPSYDLSGYESLRLKLDIRNSLGTYWYDGSNWVLSSRDLDDGWNIEYSINGSAWTVLGNDGSGINWYNNSSITSLGADGWSDKNNVGTDDTDGKSKFQQASISLPVAFENQSDVRFRMHFTSDGDSSVYDGVNFDNILIAGVPQILTAPIIAPGDQTTNLRLWLKADAESFSDGDPITTISDQAFSNDAESIPGLSPTFKDNSTDNFNFNPIIDFDDASSQELQGKGGFFTTEYFVVMQANNQITAGQTQETIISGRTSLDGFAEDGTGLYINSGSLRFGAVTNLISTMVGATPGSLTGAAFANDNYGRAYESSTDNIDELIILNIKKNAAGDAAEIYKNGIQIDNYTGLTSISLEELPYAEAVNSTYYLGVGRITKTGTPFDSHYDGRLSEVISYAAPNSDLSQQKIQSYLGIKYGVTLHNKTSITESQLNDVDYIDTNGSVIWDTSANTGFNYDVAGIGRDDKSALNQKQSKSSNPGSIVTMGLSDIYDTNSQNIASNPDNFTDGNFLMWGNNDDSFAPAPDISVDMSSGIAGLSSPVNFTSIQRTWKVIETGSVGAVKVSVPETSLSATITPPGNFLMFVSDTPSFDPSSEYRVLTQVGANLETTYNFTGTKYITFGYAPEYTYERSITFDGAQDYMDADDVADLSGPFTISAWVKRASGSTNNDIISKRDIGPWTEGYALRINNAGRPRIEWKDAGGSTRFLNSSVVLPSNEWHHIAVAYDGTRATFYIDGIEDTNKALAAPAASDQHFMIAAGNYLSPTLFFAGTVDEVRVWNTNLAVEQLRYVMNQEILKFTDASVNGKIIPQTISKNEIASIPWTNLEIYLPMNRYTFTNVKDESDNNHVAAIKNLETVDYQSAPLPYRSISDGDYANSATWAFGSTQQLPGAASIVDGTPIDWNIVQTNHNVYTSEYTTLQALDVQSNEFTVTNDRFVSVSHYLKLDGTMDLEGESQLIQTENSDLDPLSFGRLERDQQGTSDTYSYNFYSSPVGAINISNNNAAYTIGSMMNDGTDPLNPESLNFSGGLDGAATSPITISAYWMYKFANTAGGNNAWQYVGPFGSIDVGLGYTMKGPGTGGITDDQNYTFIGKPNNSTSTETISHFIAAGNNTLVGNPFPSTLNADLFIADNAHLSGTLYFWEHWGGGSHVLAEYEGGYAMYNLSGGMPAVSHPLVSGAGVGTKTPTKNIAVGQGYFVTADADGDIEFSNSQRKFALESSSSVFFFGQEVENTSNTKSAQNTEDIDPYLVPEEDLRPKFRIGYDSPKEYHRQLLLTVDENASFNLDRGYDAIILDAPSEDMSWKIEGKNVGIQGVPNITDQNEFPLRILTTIDGIVKIGIDQLENVDETETTVYLKDNLLDETYNLYSNAHEVYVWAGEHNDRFSIVFVPVNDDSDNEGTGEETDNEESEEEETDNEGTGEDTDNEESEESDTEGSGEDTDSEESQDDSDMQIIEVDANVSGDTMELSEVYVSFHSQTSTIAIRKNAANEIKNVRLFSILGQVIRQWSPDKDATQIELPADNVSTGTYILDIETSQGVMTKKLIIH